MSEGVAELLNAFGDGSSRWTGQVIELVDVSHVKVAIGSKVRTCTVPAAYSWVNVGQDVIVLYDGNLASVDGIAGAVSGGGLAPGDVVPFAGPLANIPRGRLICSGLAVSRTAYAALFRAIGTTWGAGDGTTTFNLPPGGITLVGYKSGDAIFGTPGSTGGSKNAVVVSHDHTYYNQSNTTSPPRGTGSAWTVAAIADISHSTSTKGESGTNKNMPPYGVVCMTIQT